MRGGGGAGLGKGGGGGGGWGGGRAGGAEGAAPGGREDKSRVSSHIFQPWVALVFPLVLLKVFIF